MRIWNLENYLKVGLSCLQNNHCDFWDYSHEMVRFLGEGIINHLQTIYITLYSLPEAKEYAGLMSNIKYVQSIPICDMVLNLKGLDCLKEEYYRLRKDLNELEKKHIQNQTILVKPCRTEYMRSVEAYMSNRFDSCVGVAIESIKKRNVKVLTDGYDALSGYEQMCIIIASGYVSFYPFLDEYFYGEAEAALDSTLTHIEKEWILRIYNYEIDINDTLKGQITEFMGNDIQSNSFVQEMYELYNRTEID